MRLVAIFLVAILTMTLAYAAGFFTAGRVPATVWQQPAAAPLAAGLAGVGGAVTATLPAGAPHVDIGSGNDSADAFAVFWDALGHVQSEYAGPAPTGSELTYGAIRGSLKALGDPFTLFTDPEVTEVQKVELDGEFEGIGAYVNENELGQLVIQTPMRGQPAEKAGVLSGDIVLKVDGKDISGLDVNDAVLLIRGPKGSPVVLTIKREDEPELLEISVVRDRIEIPSVSEARILDKEGAPEVGYIQLTVFAEETKAEMDVALDELQQKGAKAIVLDLRNNPGGYLETAIQVASEFLDTGIVVMQEDGQGRKRSESARSDGHATTLPLVVLINKGSASASEIVAGAIRDNKRGLLVGETSYGKGSVQNVHSLSDESQLRVTVAAWLTPNGSHIHKKGIPPDVEVARTAEDAKADKDPQLERAIEEAKKALTGGEG
jgi:carboxyl-terminal processing protease